VRRLLAALAAFLLLGPGLIVLAPANASATDGLRAVVIPSLAESGTTVRVTGENWSPNGQLQVMTCGNLGRGGTPSCDVSKTYTVIANDKGAFQTFGKLGDPPVPCPCVVHITEASTSNAVNIPVSIIGHPAADPTAVDGGQVVIPEVQVVTTQLTGWGPFLSLFGGAPQRTLELTVRNTTERTIDSAQLTFVDGTSGDGHSTKLGPLQPHEITTFDIPVTLSAGVGGPRSLTGSIDYGPQFVAETTSYAWGFYALDIILLGVLIIVVVNRLRRRGDPPPAGRHAPKTNGDAAVPEPTPEVDQDFVPFPARE
jgi:hypothetical protein